MRRFAFFVLLIGLSATAFADTIEVPVVNYVVNADKSVTGVLQNGIAVLFSTVPLDINHYDVLRVAMPGASSSSIGTYSNSLNNLTISIPNGTFTDIVGDFYGVYSQLAGGGFDGPGSPCSLAYSTPGGMCDPLLITENFSDGTSSVLSLTDLNTDPDGHNPFIIEAPDGKSFSSIFIGGLSADTQAKFYALADISISGSSVETIEQAPEPATLALIGIGIGALKIRRRRVTQ